MIQDSPELQEDVPLVKPLDELKKEFFADYLDQKGYDAYMKNREVSSSILSQGENSPSSMWITLIFIIFFIFLLCFSQNCGHLISKKLVFSGVCCPGGLYIFFYLLRIELNP